MNKLRKKGLRILLIGIGCLLFLIPLVLYLIRFSGNGYSLLTTDWANFSTYMGLAISTISTLIIGALTVMLYKYNQDRDGEAKRREEVLDRPIIVFRKFKEMHYYSLCNIGKEAALNIKIKTWFNIREQEWRCQHIAYSLKEGDEVIMIWTKDCKCIVASYDDIFGINYYSYMEDDSMSVFRSDTTEEQFQEMKGKSSCGYRELKMFPATCVSD